MRVLIVTTPLGEGHNAVAKALYHYFQDTQAECLIMDMYEYIDPMLKEIITRGFMFSMKSAAYVKGVASEIYDLNERRNMNSDFSLSRFANALLASELNDFIGSYEPDVIICTQVYAAQVMNILKERKATGAICVGIITDFTVQSYWEDVVYFEHIVVADQRLSYQLKERGIAETRVLPFGIPIDPRFGVEDDGMEMIAQLQLTQDKFTILMMGGGMGFGNMEEYLAQIDVNDLDVQTIVVCGKNKRLYERLQRSIWQKPVYTMGYVDYIPKLMTIAQCFIGKPGGITTSEVLAKALPMIMVDPLPGVEDRNVEFLLNNGAAMLATSTYSVSEALALLINVPEVGEHLRAGMKLLAKPEATKQLGDYLIGLVKK